MMRAIKNKGFTLIELMVVIVIIGVLASLAIPRFSEASAKAKAAEAPRVLASYESAYLGGITGLSESLLDQATGRAKLEDLPFDAPKDSKWFTYETQGTATTYTASVSGTKPVGSLASNGQIYTQYNTGASGTVPYDCFSHSGTNVTKTNAIKMFPNFVNDCNGGFN